MIQKSYPLIVNENRQVFAFDSIGPKGRIAKIVVFDLVAGDVWNLGFGDRNSGDWDDEVISNNGDLVRVVSTVAQAALQFSGRWPKRKILINPVDEKRKKLYNTIFKRHYHEIEQIFEITGMTAQGVRSYKPDIFFHLFLLTRKKQVFL
jgi:hypothetical protein